MTQKQICLIQGSRTQIDRWATFKWKNLSGPQITTKSPKMWVKHLYFYLVKRCLRAAQTHLVGHIRPAGGIFETPSQSTFNFSIR